MLNPRTMIDENLGQPGVNQWQDAQKKEIGQKHLEQKYA
jgi:hypothetical protein